MSRLRTIAVVIAAVAVAAALAAGSVVLAPNRASLPFAVALGGPFELELASGGRFSSQVLKNKPYVIFFGYTQCPDVCPTTLTTLSTLIDDLKGEADKLEFLFVSVDPERDDAAHLKSYLSVFAPRIRGLTGTAPEIDDIARKYRIVHDRVPISGGYTINHSALVYLMDGNGGFMGTLSESEPHDVQLAKLKRLATGAGA